MKNAQGNELIDAAAYKEVKTGYEAFNVIVQSCFEPFQSTPKEPVYLTRDTQMRMYTSIFNGIAETVQKGKLKLGNDAVNYIAQLYWSVLSVNGSENTLDQTIFDKQVTARDLPTIELAIIYGIFKGSPLCIEVAEEIKRRS